MRKINWTCPECGASKIVISTTGIVESTPIIGIADIGYEPVFDNDGTQFYDSDYPHSYECAECEHVICTGSDDDFVNAIKELIEPYVLGQGEYALADGQMVAFQNIELRWDSMKNRFEIPKENILHKPCAISHINAGSYIGNGRILMGTQPKEKNDGEN